MNSDFVQQAARKFATQAGNVETAIKIAFHRDPTDNERKILGELARDQGLSSACLAILNSSEFLYIP